MLQADEQPIRRRRLSRGAREQQLMDIAQELFISRGYADTSIEDIVRAAGVTRPILYEHFGSKEGIYLGCVQRARRKFEADLAAVSDPDLPPIEQFAAGSHVYFELLEDDPLKWELLFGRTGLVGDSLGDELIIQRTDTILQVAALYQAVVPTADPMLVEAFAYSISGCAEQLGRWWLRHPDYSRQQVVDLHLALVWPTLDLYMKGIQGGAKEQDLSPLRPVLNARPAKSKSKRIKKSQT
jgi:AcrR family transcriptional regulator